MLTLSSISAFADCSVSLTQWGVNGEHLNDSYVLMQVSETLESKGYVFSQGSNSELNLHLHYYGMISDTGKSKTVGTVLSLSKIEDGKRNRITEARSESFVGSQTRISKRTLQQNISKIADSIPSCI